MNNERGTPLLIIEDDVKLADLISTYLSNHHFDIQHAEGGISGIERVKKYLPQLVILDLMLPELDGLSVCKELRTFYHGRIIILTASDEDMDQVACLEIGADDFISKPVHPRVLLARIKVLLKRDCLPPDTAKNSYSDKNVIVYGGLSIQYDKRRVLLDQREINLTEAEFSLLWLFAKNPERTLSRDEIMQQTRGLKYDGFDRSIDNRVVSLRKKLSDNKGLPKRILTVRGKGYLFVTDRW
jgi:two-component system response regulator RstA